MAQDIFSQLAQEAVAKFSEPAVDAGKSLQVGGADDPTSAIFQVAQERGINPAHLLGLAKLETRGGAKTVKGGGADTLNLFNVKGEGIRARDRAEGSNDSYRQYGSYRESAEDLVSLLERRYPDALKARTPEEFARALKQGGYATDPAYEAKLARTIRNSGGVSLQSSAQAGEWDQGRQYIPMGATVGDRQTQEEKPSEGTDGWLKRGWNKASDMAGITGSLINETPEQTAERVAQAARYADANRGSKAKQELGQAWERGDGIIGGLKEVGGEIAKDYREGGGFAGGLVATGRNLKALAEGTVEQLPNAVLPMTGMAVGGLTGSMAGPAGTVAGGFVGGAAGSAAIEGGGMLLEALQKAGINPQDKQAVAEFIKANGDELLGRAGIKSAILSAVDTLTLKAGSKLLNGPVDQAVSKALKELGVDVADKVAVKTAMKTAAVKEAVQAKVMADPAVQAASHGWNKVARNVGAAALEPGGEFLGEYAGTGIATGDWDTKNAALEAFSSVGQSVGTFGAQKAWQGVKSGAVTAAKKSNGIVSRAGLAVTPGAQQPAGQPGQSTQPNQAGATTATAGSTAVPGGNAAAPGGNGGNGAANAQPTANATAAPNPYFDGVPDEGLESIWRNLTTRQTMTDGTPITDEDRKLGQDALAELQRRRAVAAAQTNQPPAAGQQNAFQSSALSAIEQALEADKARKRAAGEVVEDDVTEGDVVAAGDPPAAVLPDPPGAQASTPAQPATSAGFSLPAFDNSPLPKTDPAAAEEQRRQAAEFEQKRKVRRAATRSSVWDRNPFLAFLGANGINRDVANEFAPGLVEKRKAFVPGYGPVFRSGAKNLDELVQNAKEDGFLREDDDTPELYDLIERALRGERIAPLYADGAAEAEGQRRLKAMQERDGADFEDYLQQAADFDPFPLMADSGYDAQDLAGTDFDQADDAVRAEVAALAAQYADLGFDPADVLEALAIENENQPEQTYYDRARTRLTDLISQAYAQAQPQGSGAVRADRAEPLPSGEAGARGPAAGQQVRPAAPTPKLRNVDELAAEGFNRVVKQGDKTYFVNPDTRESVELDSPAQIARARARVQAKQRLGSLRNSRPQDFALDAVTPEALKARDEQAQAAQAQQTAEQQAAAEKAKADDERKRIEQASYAAADSFELGQNPLDSLTGQQDIFSAAPADAGSIERLRKDAENVFIGDVSDADRSAEKTAIDAGIVAAINAGVPEEDVYNALFADGVTSTNLSRLISAAPVAADLAGERINGEWVAFDPQSGTLGIPRAQMPQIKAEHRGAMINFLKARGIDGQQETIPSAAIKPTQAEFSPAKVKQAMDYQGGNRSIIVSADGYVVDGHHQWLAAREKGEPIQAIRLDQNIGDVLTALKDMPSAQPEQPAAQNASASNSNTFKDPKTGQTVVVSTKATADAMANSKQLKGRATVRKATQEELKSGNVSFVGYDEKDPRDRGYVIELSDSGDTYEQRNADRVARAKAADTQEAWDAITAEENADPERHFEGTDALRRAINGRRLDLKPDTGSFAIYPDRQQDAETAATDSQYPLVTHTTAKGKVLRGYIVRGMTKEQVKANIDEYPIPVDGGFFVREKHKDKLPKIEAGEQPAAAPAQTAIKKPTKKQAEKLFSGEALEQAKKKVKPDAGAFKKFKSDGFEAEFQSLLARRQNPDGSPLSDDELDRFVDLRTARNQAIYATENAGGVVDATQPAAAPAQQDGQAGAKAGGFDSAAFDKARSGTIQASRDAGNTHLDQMPAYVETMRGKAIFYVHDPKVTGVIRTIDNNKNVYVDWSDAYSAEKEMASPTQEGKKTVYRSTIGPRDLKDYALAPDKREQGSQDAASQQGITADDVAAAEKQAAQMIEARIDGMKAPEVQRIAARFLPTVGVKVPMGKAKIKAAMTDAAAMNLLAPAGELGIELPDSVKRALVAKMEGRVEAGQPAAQPGSGPVSTEGMTQAEAQQALESGQKLLHDGKEVWVDRVQSGAVDTYVIKRRDPDSSVVMTKGPAGPRGVQWGKQEAARKAVETMGLPQERALAGREGYDTPVELDAAQLKTILEQTRGEPLAAKPAKLEAWRNGTAKTDPTKFPIELFLTPDGKLDVNDGRHRIALAAERGEKVTAFIDGKDAQRVKDLLKATGSMTASKDALQQRVEAVIARYEQTAMPDMAKMVRQGLEQRVKTSTLTEQNVEHWEDLLRRQLATRNIIEGVDSKSNPPVAPRNRTVEDLFKGDREEDSRLHVPQAVLDLVLAKANEFVQRAADLGVHLDEIDARFPKSVLDLKNQESALRGQFVRYANQRKVVERGYKNAKTDAFLEAEQELGDMLGVDLRAMREQQTAASGAVDPDLEAIFDQLDGLTQRTQANGQRAAAAHPQAERIQFVQKHILDILQDLEDAGKVTINC